MKEGQKEGGERDGEGGEGEVEKCRDGERELRMNWQIYAAALSNDSKNHQNLHNT